MKNSPARPKAKSARTPTPRTRKPAPLAIPPLVAAVARFTDPESSEIDAEFVTAWAHMPAVFQAHLVGESSSNDHTTWFGVLSQMIDAELARSRNADESYARHFAEYHGVLDATHPDAVTIVTTPYTTASFQIGVAFACYMLTNGGAR